jgi:tetratricopeptide (TPR) repeat protein
MSLGNYTSAIKCYEEMLERAKELKDSVTEAQAYGNLGIARINMGSYEEAGQFFELQLSVLESLSGSTSKVSPLILVERGRAYGNLGDCCTALNDHEEAIRCYEKSIQISIKTNNFREQERTYKCLGSICKSLGNSSAALSYFEKRMGVINIMAGVGSTTDSEFGASGVSTSGGSGGESGSSEVLKLKGSGLSDLGQEYLDLRNFDQALNCFQQQLNIAKETDDNDLEAEAVSSLGRTFQLMGKYQEALQYHSEDLRLSQDLGSVAGKARAYGNIGLVHESMGNYEQALLYQEHHLNATNKSENSLSKAVAFSSIGKFGGMKVPSHIEDWLVRMNITIRFDLCFAGTITSKNLDNCMFLA